MAALIIDTHAHYDDERFAGKTGRLFPELHAGGMAAVISCAVDQHASYEQNRRLAEQFDFCYFTAGVHPLNMEENGPLDLPLLRAQAAHEKCVAIGEIGLDYHYKSDDKAGQIALVAAQLQLANDLRLPVSFHDRDAHEDTLRLLNEYQPRGVVHCFSGSVEMAQEILRLGMYIGIGGVITFQNAKKLVHVAEQLPLERILLETDAPYLAPVPYRGQINRSDYILKVAERIAEIKGTTTEAVLSQCKQNAETLFGLPQFL